MILSRYIKKNSTFAIAFASVEEIDKYGLSYANAIAMTSYQGGHTEYLKYMYDLLQEKKATHIKIFAGGGGTILPEEIKELEPNLASVYYKGQVFMGSRHTTNPLAISKKIFSSFIQSGGKFLQKKITNVIHTDENVTLSFGIESQVFDQFIVSTGAWSNIIANYIGDNFPLDTERGYHVLFDNSEALINRPIGWSQSGFYLIQIEEGIRAAGTLEIAGLHKTPNEKRIRMIERQARKILPQLGKVKKEWMGYRPTLPDSLPVIGQSKKNSRIFYAFGHQHIGWTLAAITGKIIDSLIKVAHLGDLHNLI